jgi:hypothetical protein
MGGRAAQRSLPPAPCLLMRHFSQRPSQNMVDQLKLESIREVPRAEVLEVRLLKSLDGQRGAQWTCSEETFEACGVETGGEQCDEAPRAESGAVACSTQNPKSEPLIS